MAFKSDEKSPKLWWDFRYIWMFLSSIWVFTLTGGLIGVWQTRRFLDPWPGAEPEIIISPTWVQVLATILVIAFIVVYLEAMYRMYFGRATWVSDISIRERWSIRAPLLIIAIVLVFLPYEDRLENWPFTFVFVVIAWTLTAQPSGAFAAVVTSTAGSALLLTLAYNGGVALQISIYSLAFGFFTSGYVINRGLINELRLERGRVRDQAVTEERFRLARDLHDTVGHSMTQITLKSELARRTLSSDPARAEQDLADVEELSRSLSAQVRQSIAGDVDVSLANELTRATELLQSMDIGLTSEGDAKSVPDHIADVFAWCLREGVMNVIKHSGANQCEIVFSRVEENHILNITDNGHNPVSAEHEGQGIAGMKQRVNELGGELEFLATEAGHVLTIRIPA